MIEKYKGVTHGTEYNMNGIIRSSSLPPTIASHTAHLIAGSNFFGGDGIVEAGDGREPDRAIVQKPYLARMDG
jgi:hypothetical protein